MSAYVTLGRTLFALLFIVSGAFKFLDIEATAQSLSGKITIPGDMASYVTQLEAATGYPSMQLLAMAAAGIELLCGLMIAANFGTKFFAAVLILFIIAATVLYHDFWNQTGDEARNNIIHLLKNVALIGGLLVIAGYPRLPRSGLKYSDV